MKTRLLRKNSTGIKATLDRCKHHANNLTIMVRILNASVETLGFKEWLQGDTVHIFVAPDGRKFDFVGYKQDDEYQGIEFRLRESRTKSTTLTVVKSLDDLPRFMEMIKLITRPFEPNQINNLSGNQA